MERLGLLVNYSNCDACGLCVEACRKCHSFEEGISGLKISKSGPYTLGSGKEVCYNIATPTDFCDKCNGCENEKACEKACPNGCLHFDSMTELAKQVTQKNLALFSL